MSALYHGMRIGLVVAASLLTLAGCVGKGKAPAPSGNISIIALPEKLPGHWIVILKTINIKGKIGSRDRACMSEGQDIIDQSQSFEQGLRSLLSDRLSSYTILDQNLASEFKTTGNNIIKLRADLLESNLDLSSNWNPVGPRNMTLSTGISIRAEILTGSGNAFEVATSEPVELQGIVYGPCDEIYSAIKAANIKARQKVLESFESKLLSSHF